MKSFIYTLCLTAAVLLTASCTKPMSARIDKLENKISTTEGMTEEQVNDLVDEYEDLLEEFRTNYDKYADEEKQAIYKSIGKMNATIAKYSVKNGMNDLLEELTEFTNAIPSMLDGFKSGLTGDKPDTTAVDSSEVAK